MKKLTKRPMADNTIQAYACVCTECSCVGCGCSCDNSGTYNSYSNSTRNMARDYDDYDDNTATANHK